MLRSIFVAMVCCSLMSGLAFAESGVYELRIYTCEPGKLDALHARFKDHTMGIFEKHGMKNIAYWVPVDENNNQLIYIIHHESREAAARSWDAFRDDPEWKAVAKASQEAHGKILAKAPESTFMVLTDYSPTTKPLNPQKVYELRTYTTAEGKLDALNARFRDHTISIFARHGLKSYAYWTPIDKPTSENTLIYVLEYDSRDAAKTGWQNFAADPEWKKARADSEKAGKILAQRPGSVYMVPTIYSPAK